MPPTPVTPETFAAWRATARACRGVTFVNIDLRPHDAYLAALPQARHLAEACTFVGCALGPALAAAVAATGALIVPRLDAGGIDAFRTRLYEVDELYAGFDPDDPAGYRSTFDWRVYRAYMRVDDEGEPVVPPQRVPVGLVEEMARRLHDGSVTDALEAFLQRFRAPAGAGVVAVMGGHDVPRDAPEYGRVALLARTLTRRGMLVATGGGPGMMEAANLGGWSAAHDDGVLGQAVALLAAAPTFRSPGWVRTAWDVRHRFGPGRPGAGVSLGVPTWFYGHEPPNLFASHIAKYFENSVREEGLLAIATQGVVFAPGRAGTIQEIFQDACQNYYSVYGVQSPMILLGRDYWQGRPYPVWPLLEALAGDRSMRAHIHITDDTDDVVAIIDAFAAAPPG